MHPAAAMRIQELNPAEWRSHYDVPMRDCTVMFDKLVDSKMIVERVVR
jgi:hypothetical protein